jgi:hypothetical protein
MALVFLVLLQTQQLDTHAQLQSAKQTTQLHCPQIHQPVQAQHQQQQQRASG